MSLYLSERLGHGSSHLVFPGPSLLPLLQHLSSIQQQLWFPLAKCQVLVDGSHLILAVTAGLFFGFCLLLGGDAVFRPVARTGHQICLCVLFLCLMFFTCTVTHLSNGVSPAVDEMAAVTPGVAFDLSVNLESKAFIGSILEAEVSSRLDLTLGRI